MEFRFVIHYCYLRGLSGDQTLNEMEKAYNHNVPGRATVFRWLKKFKEGKMDIDDEPRSGKPPIQENKLAILNALEKEPYASTYRIEELTGINQSTVWTTLTHQMHYKLFICKWVPYKIDNKIKEKRVELSKLILDTLNKGAGNWSNIITGDESWFFWRYDKQQQWLPENSERPQIPKANIGSEKSLFSIYFSARGVIVCDSLPKNARFNSSYFVETILPQIESFYKKFRPSNGCKNVILHIDNARPHNSLISKAKIEEFGLKRMKHPPYSPDLSPCDFWLFGYLKEKLKGNHFTCQEDLKNKIIQILNEIPKNQFNSVYEEWIKRLKQVIKTGGEYI